MGHKNIIYIVFIHDRHSERERERRNHALVNKCNQIEDRN